MQLRLLCAAVMMLVTAGTLAFDEVVSVGPQAQSLLLEANENGEGTAEPIPGTVHWSRNVDENGHSTLVGVAAIPTSGLEVRLTIHKNVDAALPASHLMELNFHPSADFNGGTIAGLPGVLLKNDPTVLGEALVGASARIEGNNFLFALSGFPEYVPGNMALLSSQSWVDLAVIYGTGRRAIVSMEKDAAAMQLFTDVLAEWNTDPNPPNRPLRRHPPAVARPR